MNSYKFMFIIALIVCVSAIAGFLLTPVYVSRITTAAVIQQFVAQGPRFTAYDGRKLCDAIAQVLTTQLSLHIIEHAKVLPKNAREKEAAEDLDKSLVILQTLDCTQWPKK
jgi:hypothetical protein